MALSFLTPLTHDRLRGHRLVLVEGDGAISWRRLIDGLRHGEPGLIQPLTSAIAQSPWPALFFECTPVRAGRLELPFEAALVDAPALAGVRADPGAFREHLAVAAPDAVVRFPNLSGDADLVVPAALGAPQGHAHLAAFCRSGPPAQVAALWQATGRALSDRLARDGEPVWLSTSGLGVPWLHLRLDARPKYYTWAPYRTAVV